MKEKKETSNRKRQLLLALFMLIVSSITLTTASYAWFTANTNVSISDLDVNVGASNGIQISTDAVTWKATITKADITTGAYDGNINQVPASIAPVSTVGDVITTTSENDVKGRMKMFSGRIDWEDAYDPGTPEVDTDDYGTYLLTAGELFDAKGASGQYIAFDIFLLVQQDETLYLTTGSVVTADGADTGLKNSARVAFLNEGHTTSEDSAGAVALVGATSSIIWEPNNNVHTAAAVDNNNAIYGTTITNTQAIASYSAVKAVIGTGIPYNSISTVAPGNAYLGSVTPDISTPAIMTGYEEIFALEAGINKVRIYAWVEGQDIDCETNASGSDITFTLKFSKNEHA